MQPPLGGADGDLEDGSNLGDRPLLEVMQGKDRALVDREAIDRTGQGVTRDDGLEPRVMLPGKWAFPPSAYRSGVSPADQVLPWPRVSMTKWA